MQTSEREATSPCLVNGRGVEGKGTWGEDAKVEWARYIIDGKTSTAD